MGIGLWAVGFGGAMDCFFGSSTLLVLLICRS